MKKRFIKSMGLFAGVALSLSLFGACAVQPELSVNSGVVKAFYAVAPVGDLVSQTAVADGQEYLVTVVTSSSVSEYRVNSEFEVGVANTIVGGTNVPTALAEGGDALSELERAYEEALRLSGIAKTEVEGFDFDKDTYMGKAVFKVEIEDAVAEYSYTFDAADFSLIASKTELKSTVPSGGGTSYIGEARAKEIALGAVEITEDQAENFVLRSVLDSGRKLYKASFGYDGFRYAIDLDAVNGEIVKFSKTVTDGQVTLPEIPSIISEEEAKQIALAFVFPDGAENKNVTFRKVKLDYEKGSFLYEIEFFAEGNEYEIEISAADGTILDIEIDAEKTNGGLHSGQFITREEAVSKVLEQAGEGAFLLEVDIDKEYLNGQKRYFYEIEVKVNGREVEYYVDAITGEVTLNGEYEGNPANPTPALTQQQALQIALDDFRLTADQITRQKIKLEREDGRLCYEIKLYVGNVEYKMSIDANSGLIIEREIDREHEDQLPSQPQTGNYITPEEAAAKVEDYLKSNGLNGVIQDVELDDEGTGASKHYYYEVDVLSAGKEYEYHVDALTGEVTLKGEIVNGGSGGSGESGTLGEQEALQIALDAFKLTADKITARSIKLERENGKLCYEIKLYVGNVEYKMSVDAQTGDILEQEIDYEHEDQLPSRPQTGNYITAEQARAAVLEYFAGKGKTARIKEVELEDEGTGANKRYYYEVEAIVENREYECYVDALTGEVRVKGELVDSGKNLIGEERALAIALDYYSLTRNEAGVIKVKLEEDDGRLIYEVEFKVKDLEYSFEIDAETGKILDIDVSFD